MNQARHSQILRERDSDTLAVFIHGFLGSPAQFGDLAEAAYGAGASTFSLLLPGHGGNVRMFAESTRADWKNHVCDSLAPLAGRYRRVVITAHSMGGLLALNASLNASLNIRELMLLATPLKLRIWSPYAAKTYLRTNLTHFDEPVRRTYDMSRSVSDAKRRPLSLYRPYRELLRLMRETRDILPRVSVPVTLVYSRLDETTAFYSAEMMRRALPDSRLVVLEKSLHAHYDAAERLTVRDLLTAMCG